MGRRTVAGGGIRSQPGRGFAGEMIEYIADLTALPVRLVSTEARRPVKGPLACPTDVGY